MKYKLLKQIEEKDSIKVGSIFDIGDHRSTLDIDIPECQVPISFLISQGYIEEVKEPKTIYDLKKGDEYFYFGDALEIEKQIMPFDYFEGFLYITQCFVTECEAKRNKLLRELATRTSKHLPKKGENYYSFHLTGCDIWNWQGDNTDMVRYHQGLVFRNEEEYNKYLTEEAKDLLFNI